MGGAGTDCRRDTGHECAARAKGRLEDWLKAFELALDQRRFDLVELLVVRRGALKTSVEDWLHISRVLVVRHTLQADQTDTAALARSYAGIREQLPLMRQVAVTRSLLARHAARFFLQCGDYPQAIAMAKLATEAGDEWMRLVTQAEAYCHLDDLETSLTLLDRVLALSMTPKYLKDFATLREKEAMAEHYHPKFDPVTAARALFDLQTVLAQSGQKAFLMSGTLLGYAREGGLLAHDKDVDVGIVDWESQFDVVIALLRSGLFQVSMKNISGERTYYIPIRHVATNTWIDIFVYHLEDGKLVTGVRNAFGFVQRFAYTPFELEQVTFLDIPFHVPADIDRNLTENFGSGWRVSDPNYLSLIEAPSILNAGDLAFQIRGRLTILQMIREAKPRKLERALEVLAGYRQLPGGIGDRLWQDLNAFCEAALREQLVA